MTTKHEVESYTVAAADLVDTMALINRTGGVLWRSSPVGAGYYLTVMWKREA